MTAPARYTVQMFNTAAGVLNPALVGFTFGNPATDDEQRVAAACYFIRNSAPVAAGTGILGVRKTPLGGGAGVDLPFPLVEYDALVTALGGSGLTAYGETWGAGGLTPAGTSITTVEYSATPGRTSTGRFYTPYLSNIAVDPAGQLPAINAGIIDSTYATVFGLTGAPGVPLVRPIVWSTKDSVQHTITTPKTSRTLATLRSRKR